MSPSKATASRGARATRAAGGEKAQAAQDAKAARYHHGALRAALLDAARQRLAQDGYEALSLRELARDIGVAASAPYFHFGNRDALFAALIQEGARSVTAVLQSAGGVPGAPAQRLAAACHAFLGFAQQERELYRLMFTSPTPLSPVFASDVRTALDHFDALVAAAAGAEDAQAVQHLALACWSTLHGFAMLRLHARLLDPVIDAPNDLIVAAVLRQVTPAAP